MSNKRRIGPKKAVLIPRGAEMDALRALGLNPKAPPRSGRCMMCGNDLQPTEDHSVCDSCWPPGVDPKWKEPDPEGGPAYTVLDADTGELTAYETNPLEEDE